MKANPEQTVKINFEFEEDGNVNLKPEDFSAIVQEMDSKSLDKLLNQLKKLSATQRTKAFTKKDTTLELQKPLLGCIFKNKNITADMIKGFV